LSDFNFILYVNNKQPLLKLVYFSRAGIAMVAHRWHVTWCKLANTQEVIPAS